LLPLFDLFKGEDIMEKIIGALSFKSGVYAEAKKDAGFSGTAWLIVAASAVLSALGNSAGLARGHIFGWLLGSIFGSVFQILGFALAVLIIMWVGKTVFNATASFDELARPLGLARIWHVVGVLGLLALLSPSLGCVVGIFNVAAFILGFIAWLWAVHEALGLDWAQAITVVILGTMVVLVITFISTSILGLFGFLSASFIGNTLGNISSALRG
jgi:hypothetical protein